MPVAVKFSERFYRKLGHEAVDELVNWFNQVDSTYRGDLRELNEHNFARFDAKLEQRVTQLDAKLEQRLTQVEERLARRMADLRADLIKWMFVFWAGSVASTALLVFGLAHFLRP